jgi:hypothetical protein
MKRPLLGLSIVGIVLVVWFAVFLLRGGPRENINHSFVASHSANEERATFKTYKSELGFSFDYPSHLEVSTFSEGKHWIVLTPSGDNSEQPSRIIVSVAKNDERMTAEEWLLSEWSGYKQSQKEYGDYHKILIGGQDAVSTDGGMWSVVNTPDGKYRLSIADMRGGDGDRLLTEMRSIAESFAFAEHPEEK